MELSNLDLPVANSRTGDALASAAFLCAGDCQYRSRKATPLANGRQEL